MEKMYTLSVYIPVELKDKLQALADKDRRKLSEFARMRLEDCTIKQGEELNE